jgi:hypothetical protein
MNRRIFLQLAAGALVSRAAAETGKTVADDGVRFAWSHRGGRLHAILEAPTRGWIAAGFNAAATLEGTRFVIAAVALARIVAEEHIALVPDHKRVELLGGAPALRDVEGAFATGVSRLRFSLPEAVPGPHPLDLGPGRRTHLMLAWSMAPEFDHHSAWRRHYDVTL